jgi:DNA-binding SARP family transcriptional activator
MTRRVLERGEPLPDVQITLEGEGDRTAVWVSASEVDAEDVRVVFQLRAGARSEAGASAARPAKGAAAHPQLRVLTLGRFGLEVAGKPIEGRWVEERPGLLLKYLVCERHGVAPSDRIAEALWPSAGAREALTSLRHYVHVLRERLEPVRSERGGSSFVKTHRGGYRLDLERVWIDAEELERRASEGLSVLAGGEPEAAAIALEASMSLYAGEFLPDLPDADWVHEERERLHRLAARACAALVDVRLAADDLDSAAAYSRRLADLEPLDTDVQRRFIEICLRQGRRSDAVRRYDLLRSRTLREFGREPDFTLSDLDGA